MKEDHHGLKRFILLTLMVRLLVSTPPLEPMSNTDETVHRCSIWIENMH